MKRIISAILAVCMCASLCACGKSEQNQKECTHEWNEATCVLPEKCKLCGAEQGAALGHQAGEYEQSEANVLAREATMVQKCQRCGEVIDSKKAPLEFLFADGQFLFTGEEFFSLAEELYPDKDPADPNYNMPKLFSQSKGGEMDFYDAEGKVLDNKSKGVALINYSGVDLLIENAENIQIEDIQPYKIKCVAQTIALCAPSAEYGKCFSEVKAAYSEALDILKMAVQIEDNGKSAGFSKATISGMDVVIYLYFVEKTLFSAVDIKPAGSAAAAPASQQG